MTQKVWAYSINDALFYDQMNLTGLYNIENSLYDETNNLSVENGIALMSSSGDDSFHTNLNFTCSTESNYLSNNDVNFLLIGSANVGIQVHQQQVF